MSRSSAAARYQDLNQVIHERSRLAIMSYLIAAREATFSELKEELALSDGNLNLHMRVLEKNCFVQVRKEFVNRRPRTTYQVTAKGRREFTSYVALIERILGLQISRSVATQAP